MALRMIRKCLWSVVCAFVLVTVFTLASGQCEGLEITIEVAPNVLNTQNHGEYLTVHTDLGFGMVNFDLPLYLLVVNVENEFYNKTIAISFTKADNRGNLVVKCEMSDVEDVVAIGFNKLRLTGTTTGGVLFWGEQTITVR